MDMEQLTSTERRIAELTPRQLTICRQIADGKLNKEIAHQLPASLTVVKHQITAIMERTGCQNRAAIAAWYVRQTEVRQ